jgi:signal transduction histidine kinase/PAS domain-containing protein
VLAPAVVARSAASPDVAGGAAPFPPVAGLVAVAIGLLELAGGTPRPPAPTSAGICLLGAALYLLAPAGVGARRRLAGRVLAGAALLLGTWALAHYASGAVPGVERLPWLAVGGQGAAPRNPTLASALSTVALGTTLVLLRADRAGRLGAWLAGGVLAVALWALVGHLLGGTQVSATQGEGMLRAAFTPMSLSSALGFCVLALGALAARPDRGPMALLGGADAGAFMARRALLPVVVVPIALAWIRLLGERAGLYPEPIGVSLLTTFTVVALVAVVLWNARALRGLDAERRRAAEALQAARADLERALSAGAVATWRFHPADDPADDRVFGDAHLAALFAVPVESRRAGTPLETLARHIHPDDRALVVAGMTQAIERRGAYEAEYRIVLPDGSVRWLLARGVCETDPATGRLRFPGTVVDVTERRRAEDEQRLLAAAGLLLSATLDPERAGEAVAEIVVPTLADRCVVDVVDAEGGRPRPVGIAAASAAERAALQEAVARRPHGAPCLGTVAARRLGVEGPALLDAGDPAQAALLAELHAGSALLLPLVARDRRFGTVLAVGGVTRRRFDARDLALGVDLARRASLAIDNASLCRASCSAIEMRDQVLRVVAHDLKNPLASVKMNVDLLERSRGREREIDGARAARIRAAVARADRLIGDLLDVARLEAGKLELTLHREAIRPVLLEAVELHGTLTDAARHTIEVTVPDDLEPVFLDRDRVLQVLSNLLGNAIKFTPAGGRIRVCARPVEGGVRVEVVDSGPGIAPEDVPHLFRPFWQARPSSGGAGLGLAIAKGIVEAHGGAIGAEPAADGGACVWFTLPSAAATVARAGGAARVKGTASSS